MTDPILSNVKALLLAEAGDKKALERIQNAAEHDEVISVYERDYVQKLTQEYLSPKIEEKKEELEPTESITETEETVIPLETKTEEQQVFAESTPSFQKNNKTIILAIAIGIAVLVIALGVSQFETDGTPAIAPSTPSIAKSGLTIDADRSSYDKADIISISGSSEIANGKTISLSIINPIGTIIWTEDVKTKDSGEYSTLLIAGRGSGWDDTGQYTITAKQGSIENENSFTFKN